MNKLHIVFGPQGAGKSTYAKKLAADVSGVYFSIDEWMGALYGPDLPQPMDIRWVMERVQRCEQRIWATARQVVLCGGSAVLDLGFMKVKSRDAFLALAKEANIATQLHFVDAPYETRRERVLGRNAGKGATFSFEVSPAMFDYMEKELERPTEDELRTATIIDTGDRQ